MARLNARARMWVLAASAAIAASCSADPEAAKREHVARGDRYVAEKKYPEAVIEYRAAVQIDPKYGEARHKLAQAYTEIQDGVNAFREYVRAADLMPENADVQLKAGAMLLVGKRFEDAKTRAERVLKKQPRNVEAIILRANALGGLRDLDAAVTELSEAIELDPERSTSYANLGVLHLVRGKPAEAEAALKKALSIDPRSVSGHLALANFYWARGRPADAEQSLLRALEIDARHVLANRAMAVFALAARRLPDAERYLKVVAEVAPSPVSRLMLADYYIAVSRHADARPILEVLANTQGTFVAAKLRLAGLEHAEGHRERAHATLREVLGREPGNATAMVLQGRLLLAENRIEEALARVKAAVTADPRSVQAHYTLGLLQTARRDPDEAAKAFNDVLRLNPRALDAQLRLSEVHLGRGDAQTSVQFAQQAVSNRPRSGPAHFLLARGLMARGELKVAEAEMKVLLASNPKSAPVHSQMAVLHLLKKERAAARQYFEKALALDPGLVEAIDGLVALDLSEGKAADAIARIEARLRATPRDADLLLLAGKVYAVTRDLTKSERALRDTIAVDPSRFQAYGLLGQIFLAQRRLPEARREFDALAKLQPKLVAAPTMIGMIHELERNIDEARRVYEQVLEIDARAPVAANNLAWIYAERGGNLDVALQLARTAKQKLPDQPEVNDTLGWIYVKKKLPSLAIDPLRESVAKDPSNPVYHYHLGVAYQLAGDAVRARRSLEQALKLKPDFEGAAQARAALAALTAGPAGQ